jgi:hypothetical protein
MVRQLAAPLTGTSQRVKRHGVALGHGLAPNFRCHHWTDPIFSHGDARGGAHFGSPKPEPADTDGTTDESAALGRSHPHDDALAASTRPASIRPASTDWPASAYYFATTQFSCASDSCAPSNDCAPSNESNDSSHLPKEGSERSEGWRRARRLVQHRL